ncbi:hypothetical protein GQ42DRAFT_173282 [Ramicandelaber brevisporus]|nr:hypothetical protein GQ42DRAFT_173282 [Ramicandelaber brevisporus]
MTVNVGLLGHVDSGKTHLARALSATASTAAFDKNPQSKQRGITLDLGFSAFTLPPPPPSPSALTEQASVGEIQIALVDCPDATKGIQVQTAECIVLAEIMKRPVIIALNKIDLIPAEQRTSQVAKLTKGLGKALASTRLRDSQIVPIAANVGAVDIDSNGGMCERIDHCFAIRGQGTILTGTVLSGSTRVGSAVELANDPIPSGITGSAALSSHANARKIKSIQRFKRSVTSISAGDRAGICVTGLDPSTVERGLACWPPGIAPRVYGVIATAQKVRFFKHDVESGSKVHISIGHETVVATVTFIQPHQSTLSADCDTVDSLDYTSDYTMLEKLPSSPPATQQPDSQQANDAWCFVLLEFEHPVVCPPQPTYVASRLDFDYGPTSTHKSSSSSACRFAFSGRVLDRFTAADYRTSILPSKLRIIRVFERQCTVNRIVDPRQVICNKLFTNINPMIGMKVELSLPDGNVIYGHISAAFGKNGMFRVDLSSGNIPQEFTTASAKNSFRITIRWKRLTFDKTKSMIQ